MRAELILAIESSCDDLGIALVHLNSNGKSTLLHHEVHSQLVHQEYGGVVPELSARDHLKNSIILLDQTLSSTGVGIREVDLIAVTQGPGLVSSLMVGNCLAHTLSLALFKPIIKVNHLEGHIFSVMLEHDVDFPYLCLLVSGGHTQIIKVDGIDRYEVLGETVDDAVGEAFDKCAKMLGLTYPGGPVISELAKRGEVVYNLPRPMKYSKDLNMSFSGLKTAVLELIKKVVPVSVEDVCASLQEAVVDVLSSKLSDAIRMTQLKRIAIVGGVAANLLLRRRVAKICEEFGCASFYPSVEFCTDNAAMIAQVAALKVGRSSFDNAVEVYSRFPL